MSGRRFLNMLVTNCNKNMFSLSRFDLSRNQFFYTEPEEVESRGRDMLLRKDVERGIFLTKQGRRNRRKKQDPAEEKIGTYRLPAPLVSMRPTLYLTAPLWQQDKLQCFSLSETMFLFADPCGRMFIYDAELRCVVTMPSLHAPKEDPLSFTISREEPGDSIYIIEQIIRPKQQSFPFEALVSERYKVHPWRVWQCSSLPLPPYALEPGYHAPSSPIWASAVVDNRFICISVLGGVGTYCFDTASHTWSRAGDWLLSFRGMAEYVLELNLWFGTSAYNNNLPGAADLSAIVRGQPPEQILVWEDTDLPEDWFPCHARMVSLGSGRFCIARSFQNMDPYNDDVDQPAPFKLFTVLTGLEVLPAKGKGKIHRLRMVKHKSRRFNWSSDTGIIASFF